MIEIDGVGVDKCDRFCPTCNKYVETHKCRFCGVVRTVNAVSGNIIWIRNGRIVKAFKDSKDAFLAAAAANNIPRKQWPDEFKE